jgi:hypothetical protein
MQPLTREQILAADDLTRERVDVPEWGGPVFVRLMSAAEHARLGLAFDSIPKEKVREHVVALTLCDDAGNPLFTPDDVEALGRKSKDAIERVFAAAQRLNKLGAADVEAAAGN